MNMERNPIASLKQIILLTLILLMEVYRWNKLVYTTFQENLLIYKLNMYTSFSIRAWESYLKTDRVLWFVWVEREVQAQLFVYILTVMKQTQTNIYKMPRYHCAPIKYYLGVFLFVVFFVLGSGDVETIGRDCFEDIKASWTYWARRAYRHYLNRLSGTIRKIFISLSYTLTPLFSS